MQQSDDRRQNVSSNDHQRDRNIPHASGIEAVEVVPAAEEPDKEHFRQIYRAVDRHGQHREVYLSFSYHAVRLEKPDRHERQQRSEKVHIKRVALQDEKVGVHRPQKQHYRGERNHDRCRAYVFKNYRPARDLICFSAKDPYLEYYYHKRRYRAEDV